MSGFGAGIGYTCDSSIETTTCNYLNGNISSLYSSIFTNANASIYIEYTTAVGLGGSEQYYSSVSYTSYRSQLTSHESGTDDVTAVASLPSSEPSTFSGGSVNVTSALASALGYSGAAGIDVGGNSCTLGATHPTCYNGLILLDTPANLLASYGQAYYYETGSQAGNAYDIYSIVEHETNEVLGTSSCIGTVSGSPGNVCSGGMSAADLFRYSAAGTRSFTSTANGSLAYLSINGGLTSIAAYNNSPNNQDYGDWSSNCAHVQDAQGCLGQSLSIATGGRVEVAALDAVGYNLNSAPEPGTIGMLLAGIFLLHWQYRGRTRDAANRDGNRL